MLSVVFGLLAVVSLALLLWQWAAALRFPLHRRIPDPAFMPPVTLLKPLKGCEAATETCLRSWFAQDYAGPVQILFAVASTEDPVCKIVHKLQQEFPIFDSELLVVGKLIGANAKTSKLAELAKRAKHDLFVVSDADVRVPADFLKQMVAHLAPPAVAGSEAEKGQVGLVNCFYRLANPVTTAMQWEAIAINGDFWSQVLQSKDLRPLSFALGAAMLVRRKHLEEIGGFRAIADCLADDYQLGNRIARKGHRIVLCPVVVECWDPPMTWRQVWRHQLRWARTIRVCQPVPYFFSILSNTGWWVLLWLAIEAAAWGHGTQFHRFNGGLATGIPLSLGVIPAIVCLVVRMLIAFDLQRRLTHSARHGAYFWLVLVKDLLQAALWFGAFAGNTIEWRGLEFTLQRDGTLRCRQHPPHSPSRFRPK
jgi:ceramide glucosyltransferase